MKSISFSFFLLFAFVISVQAAQSTQGCAYPEWVKGNQYCAGETVSHENNEYEAKWCTLNEPGYSSDWTYLGPCLPKCTYPNWVNGNEYCAGEGVTHEGKEYEAKWCTLNEPGTSSDWNYIDDCIPVSSTKARRSRARGRKSSTRTQSRHLSTAGCAYPQWVQGVEYCAGDKVSHNNEEYEAKWCTLNEPGASNDWNDLGSCLPACKYPDWVRGKEYCAGEGVTHDGKEYEAKWCTLNEPGTSSDWNYIDDCTPVSSTRAKVGKTSSFRRMMARKRRYKICST